MSINSLITKINTGQDFTVISNDFFDTITGGVGGDVLSKFGMSSNTFILEYLKIYDYVLKFGFEGISAQGFSKEVLNQVRRGFTNPDYQGVNKNLEKDIKSFIE